MFRQRIVLYVYTVQYIANFGRVSNLFITSPFGQCPQRVFGPHLGTKGHLPSGYQIPFEITYKLVCGNVFIFCVKVKNPLEGIPELKENQQTFSPHFSRITASIFNLKIQEQTEKMSQKIPYFGASIFFLKNAVPSSIHSRLNFVTT